MREFRFRAFVDGDMGMPFNAFDPEFMSTGGTFPEGTVIMQYTGLKDKNGVEIYEGDIIALHGKVVAVIIWRDFGGWCFQWIDKSFKRVRQDVEPVFHNTSIWSEVIGNVHQNPELLNTKP